MHSFSLITRLMSFARRTASTFRWGLYFGSSPSTSRMVQNTLGPRSSVLAYDAAFRASVLRCFASRGSGAGVPPIDVAASFFSLCIAGQFRIGHFIMV